SHSLRTSGAIGAGLLAMTTVLLQVFILPWAGVVALVVQIVLTLLLPYWYMARQRKGESTFTVGTAGSGSPRLGRLVVAVARRRAVVVPVLAAATVGAAFLALQVPTEFDAKDFFSADTDFVIGLDKLDEHVGDTGGEPADIYIEADLTQPGAVAAIQQFVDELRTVEGLFARDEQGLVRIDGGVHEVLNQVDNSPAALGALAAAGIEITDGDADGVPDTTEQLEAVYEFAREFGVPFDTTRLVLTPDRVRNAIYVGEDGLATRLQLGLTDTRSQENVAAAADALDPSINALQAELRSIDPDAEVQLTGSPVVRMASLDGISNALQRSLPISVVLCLLIAAAFMRSLRYGAVTIVPILMTVAWLYAFMQIFGFAINIVTATIGAVSIGIGIDFAIHYAVRYRQELAAGNDVFEAVERAGAGTGGALVASAFSSIVGFLILALAPMPLFASYGLLTAVMIGMAGGATLLVLPSLLTLVTHADGANEPVEATSASGTPSHLAPTS
ncbi:MAG: MMPL family transporter, partial [Acidimicrobiia bacterium]|nr:MMPL family transporter [Acidimicrobiia bacterium]NNL29047.1 MMPL family transporter [Acidimicrobiia bacterium]